MTKTTLKYIINNLLKNALDWYWRLAELPSSEPGEVSGMGKLETIALCKTNDPTKIIYKSAIALKLANLWQLTPMDVAEKLARSCRHEGIATCRLDTPLALATHLEVKVVPPGLLLFELTDNSIAAWLQYFCESAPLSVGERELPFLVPEHLFKIQYSHARCCSLLRMADRDRILPLTDPNIFPRFNHPAESRLISQFFQTWDFLYFPTVTPQEINWQKVATALSEAFQNFYSQCRLWGEVKIDNPELTKGRLGLILITKYLLRFLLEEKLKIQAPTEL
ncbi:MAG: hypothetical protein F6K35_17180 [Okeania sp. SIO2H7]|nr:hypothetical protein [Okeania sp. SIO2H7]